ncbi:hypothetical protein [Desertimonas flava]|uniref:hypothetical protein n=1 Tax=Desertimonas flava TaxID=2064846 RepID=UPI000E351E4D|nr:hypothetical protein [Desertimonas flava]
MRASSISRGALALTLSAAVVAVGASSALARPTAAPIPPASGHAQVIAQGVASFSAGAHHWRLVSNDIGTAPVGIDSASPTFLVAASEAADAGPIRVSEPAGLGWLLADGEATFRPANSATRIEPTPGAFVHEIAIDQGDGADAFDPGDGLRDLDLVRDVLENGESLTVRSDVSALIFVTAGVATASDGGEVTAGTTRAIVGEVTLSNAGDVPVVVLAAIVGPAAAPVSDEVPPTTAPTGNGNDNGNGATPTQPQTTPAPTSPPTTIDPTADTDGDGLPDVDEINIYGTNPNTYDTDGDTVSDYLEAKDGNSDPFNPDTDGDGYDDREQFDGYDPRDPTSNPGAASATPTSAP